MCVFRLLFGNTAVIKIVTRRVRHYIIFTMYTNYEIYNILCLNKLIYTFFKAITAASCVDIIVNKCLNKYN